MTHHTSGQEQQGSTMQSGQGGSPVDNLTYDLISTLHTKLEGINVYDKYLKDTKGDQECRQLFQQLQQQDAEAAQKLMQQLSVHLQKGGSTGH